MRWVWWPPCFRISMTEPATSSSSSTSSTRAGLAAWGATAAGRGSSDVGQTGRRTWKALPTPRVDSTFSPAGVGHQVPRRRQPEARSLAGALRREERLENALDDVGRHPEAVVADG